ncbi:MAG: ATP-binding protein [Defluviitaleaceae bacterium]|nr:ATP-binding protein [Defluviitaleaceae bacterium]
MKKRLFISTVIIMFVGLVGFFSASVYINHANNLDMAKNSVTKITKITAGLLNDGTDLAAFVRVGYDTRITVIAPDGTVLADTQPLNLNMAENRLNRPEIQAALQGSPAAYIRRSDTLSVRFIYYALKVEYGDGYVFVRVSIPVSAINAYLLRTLPLFLFILFIVALLCFTLIRYMANHFVKPFTVVEKKLRLLSRGEYTSEPVAETFEEAGVILREIDDISTILHDTFNSLRDEKNKSDYILNNIGEGIFAVDENKNIVLINKVALDIFSVTNAISGKNIHFLTGNEILVKAVEECINTSYNTLFDIKTDGKIYSTAIRRLPETKLTLTVLSDVTENRENAKRREEFFTNASHELKTPLTAIKGFNELTLINNTDENLRNFINGITRQTDRMLLLIEGMLKLSELESTPLLNPEPVSLAQIVNEVRDTMEAAINQKDITFDLDGDGTVTAEQSHIYELVKNLIENAVRYNNRNGKVIVKIHHRKNTTELTVSDSGIGISSEEQTRIFERFYRVEKSRSQRSGGSGLGLAIVKHICALYGWTLSLKSKIGLGTEITVLFNG